MTRRRQRPICRPGAEALEARDVPSRGHGFPIGHAHPTRVAHSNFHVMTTRTLAVRRLTAQQVASRVSQAFMLFEQNTFGLEAKLPGLPEQGTGTGNPEPPPVAFRNGPGPQPPLVQVPVGTLPANPTLPNLVDQLTTYVDLALTTLVVRSDNVRQSIQRAKHVSPQAQAALVPFANAQLAQMEQTIAANPPTFNPTTGALTNTVPLQATETAFNAILNAVGEYSVHPNLFRSPSDFYINSKAHFTIPFNGSPADAMPGVYLLGPGGVPLPGPLARHARRLHR